MNIDWTGSVQLLILLIGTFFDRSTLNDAQESTMDKQILPQKPCHRKAHEPEKWYI